MGIMKQTQGTYIPFKGVFQFIAYRWNKKRLFVLLLLITALAYFLPNHNDEASSPSTQAQSQAEILAEKLEVSKVVENDDDDHEPESVQVDSKPSTDAVTTSEKIPFAASSRKVGKSEITTVLDDKPSSTPSDYRFSYLMLLHDIKSYGHGRNFDSFVKLIKGQAQPRHQTSLGVLVSSKSEYESILQNVKSSWADMPFYRLTIIHEDEEQVVSREDRHKDDVQKARRKKIAQLRNRLLFHALLDNDYVAWIDADIIRLTDGLVEKMIKSGKDIITPSCSLGNMKDYDMNAWAGERSRPTEADIEKLKAGGTYTPYHIGGKSKFVSQLRNAGSDFAKLDSVGGTFLFVKAQAHRDGALFPPLYIIGADWDRPEGWDGIETEGLCYIAKSIGYECWAMPREVIYHSG